VTPQALLAEAARRGIALYPDGHNIRYRGPKTDLADLKPKLAAHKGELLTLLRAERDKVEIDLAGGDGRNPLRNPGQPAYSILATCERYGVAMRLDSATGDLVIGKAGATADEPTQPWPSLIMALEAHLESVAVLVRAGWTLKADMPRKPVA
jgi:hypothetical protein